MEDGIELVHKQLKVTPVPLAGRQQHSRLRAGQSRDRRDEGVKQVILAKERKKNYLANKE